MSRHQKNARKVTIKRREHIPCTISRTCEAPLPDAAVHIHNGAAPCCCNKCVHFYREAAGAGYGRSPQEAPYNNTAAIQPFRGRYTKPQFNTTLRRQYELQSFEALRVQPNKDDLDLTPRSKAFIAPKLTQKMNFGNECTIFKNLVPLNVNDSIIRPRRKPVPRKQQNKNPLYEPELRDFVEEVDKLEYVIPEPELELHFTSDKFNFLQSYKDVYDFNL